MATPNNLFALFACSRPEAIKERLAATDLPFAILPQSVTNDSWFLVTKSAITTREVCDALGITDGSNGTGVVVRVENYFGRANTAVWEWITAKRSLILDVAPE